ncbi:MAG: M42 family peptidase [Verrucomicrobia bacterium]|nr:M42 family peptidase [Verrucomicrobiota bacterium]
MNKKLLERVCNAPGVSGFEDAIQTIATEILSACCDEVTQDNLGNVMGLKRATHPPANTKAPIRVMLAAHADEIGLMVKHINDEGFIHVIQMGGINAQVVESQRLIIHGKKPVRGVAVPKMTIKGDTVAVLDDLLIDTGLSKKDLEKLVRVGDVVTFENDVSLLNGKMWVGRNFDNRIGTYCLLEAMRDLGDTCVDVYAVSTVQEEVGLRGARPAAFGCAPDIGLAIDGSMARGAYVKAHQNLCEPGKGTGIYMVDNLTIGHPRLVRYLFDLCEKSKIPYQRNIGGGTDAAAMQQSRAGVISTTVGAPVRYMHSTVQLCHADDMDATVAMLVKFMQTAHIFMAGMDK